MNCWLLLPKNFASMINIVSVGKKHQPDLESAIKRYEKRLRRPWDVKWEFISPSHLNGAAARQEESVRLLKSLSSAEYVILLDEVGQNLSSSQFSEAIQSQHDYGQTITLVIGGAYGVDDQMRRRADLVLSLSKMVFPHQLVRLILIEQIYRAQQITLKSDYHHE